LDLLSLAIFALALAIGGCISGFLAGLLGVGGGIVVVPVLFQVLTTLGIDADVAAKIAVGTSLATIVPTGIQSVRAHWSRGAVDVPLLRWWMGFVAAGVIVGILIAGAVPGIVLTTVFAVVATIVAIYMLATPEGVHLLEQLPPRPVQSIFAFTIGTISTLMGIGGGTLSVPILSLCNYPVRRAVGTASVIGLVIAVPGAIGFVANGWAAPGLPAFSFGYVNILAFALIAGTSVFLAPLGARVAHTIPPRWLRRAFGFFLAITAARMMFAVITAFFFA
jgi:uncharacterized membrane protein YfcA